MSINKAENKKCLFAISPYIAVLVGLYLFRNAFLTLVLYHLGMIIALIVFRRELDLKSIFYAKSTKLSVILILCFALAGPIIYYIWNFIKLPNTDLGIILSGFGLFGSKKILFLLYFTLINPILEELYWRFLLNTKNKYISLSEILFASYHLLVIGLFFRIEYLILSFLGLLLVARLWRYLHQNLSENFIVIASHLIADFSIMFFIFKLY